MPKQFPKIALSQLANLRMGATPSRAEPSFWAKDEAGHPWVMIGDIRDKYLCKTAEEITSLGVRSARLHEVPAGIPIVSFKLSLGRAAIPQRAVYTNEAIVALFPKDGRADASWLYYAVPRAVQSTFTETAVKGQTLNLATLNDLLVPVPETVAEQRRIAEILDTADEEIANWRLSVEKLSALPLAFCGSQLGFDAGFGRIERRLDEVLLCIQAGRSPDLPDMAAGQGEWGVLKVSSVQPWGLKCTENKAVREQSLIDKSIEVKDGDLLMTRANTDDLIGLSCVVKDPPPGLMLSDKTLRLVVNPELALPGFVHLVLGLGEVRKQIRSMASGTSGSMKNISQDSIRQLRIPLPPLDSQQRLLGLMAACESKANNARQWLDKLRLVKKGLMDDLLTGKVRVGGVGGRL